MPQYSDANVTPRVQAAALFITAYQNRGGFQQLSACIRRTLAAGDRQPRSSDALSRLDRQPPRSVPIDVPAKYHTVRPDEDVVAVHILVAIFVRVAIAAGRDLLAETVCTRHSRTDRRTAHHPRN